MSHYKSANYEENAQWDDPKKIQYREQSILDPYRKYFSHSLPKNKQYWTMCGAHFNQDTPLKGELGQLAEEELITPSQFHGVDIQEEIIERNRALYPDVNWHHGDFKEVMEQFSINGDFNPGIINYDGVRGVKFSANYVTRLLWFIDANVQDDLLFSVNILLKIPYNEDAEKEGKDFIDLLLKKYNCPDHWKMKSTYYNYEGTGDRSRSVMGVFTFVKSKHKEMIFSGKRIDING